MVCVHTGQEVPCLLPAAFACSQQLSNQFDAFHKTRYKYRTPGSHQITVFSNANMAIMRTFETEAT
jgi:hypothetical protein